MSTKALTYSGLERLVRDVKNNVGLLDMPKGEILHLSAGGCTTASIAKSGGVVDISGNGNHGWAVNSDSGIIIVNDTEKGNCYYARDYSYLKIPLSESVTGDFTLTFSMKHLESSNRGYMPIRLYNNDNTQIGFVWTHASSNKASFTLDGTGEKEIGSVQIQNIWKSITIIRRNGYIEFYVDGVFTNKNATSVTNVWDYLTIYPYSRNYTDFRIYPYALSASQVKSLYVLSKQPPALLSSNRIIETTDRTSAQINTLVGQVFA